MTRVTPDGNAYTCGWLLRRQPLPDGLKVAYRIRITLYSGEALEFDDPYRFPTLLTPFELYLHGEGTNYESYRTLGAHETTCPSAGGDRTVGVRFAVWAPNADVAGHRGRFPTVGIARAIRMRLRDGGIWEIFVSRR